MTAVLKGFWGWPGWRNLLYAYVVLGVPSLVWFVFVYAGADHVTSRHSYRVPLYLEIELRIPFVPAMALFYNSLHLVYAIAPFILRTRPQMHALAAVWFLMTLVGGVLFLVIPFEPGYPVAQPRELGIWTGWYEFADQANLRYNSCPSLHVAWGAATVAVYSRSAGWLGKLMLTLWGTGLVLSTLLLHQHHVIDVAGGLLLAWWGSQRLYPRFLQRFSASRDAVDSAGRLACNQTSAA